MKKLRQIHLYLGTFFAPMLLFFAVSGIWQVLRLNDKIPALKFLSAIHTGSMHKGSGFQPNSPFLEVFVVLMSLGLVVSLITGIVMAFRFGQSKTAFVALATGILLPLVIIFVFGR
jgi:hypothetical protein